MRKLIPLAYLIALCAPAVALAQSFDFDSDDLEAAKRQKPRDLPSWCDRLPSGRIHCQLNPPPSEPSAPPPPAPETPPNPPAS